MNRMWIVAAVIAVLVVVVRSKLAGGHAVAAREKIKGGALVLDVRTPEEFAGRHYDSAINIPVQELEARMGELKDKKRAIVVYCASGARSAHAAELLRAAGFADVTNAGGLSSL